MSRFSRNIFRRSSYFIVFFTYCTYWYDKFSSRLMEKAVIELIKSVLIQYHPEYIKLNNVLFCSCLTSIVGHDTVSFV